MESSSENRKYSIIMTEGLKPGEERKESSLIKKLIPMTGIGDRRRLFVRINSRTLEVRGVRSVNIGGFREDPVGDYIKMNIKRNEK